MLKKLSNISDIDESKIEVLRLGELRENQNRPPKVCLPLPEHAFLMNRKQKIVPSLVIKLQIIKTIFSVSRKSKELSKKGKIKTIKYKNNIPTMVVLIIKEENTNLF